MMARNSSLPKPIRVLLADDDPHLLGTMRELIDGEHDMEVVATASGADDAVAASTLHRPDVAVLDVKMPGGGGTSAARRIRQLSPSTAILAMSAYDDRGPVLDMLRAGAIGYLVKGSPIDEIMEAIRRAAEGASTLSEAPAEHAMATLGASAPTKNVTRPSEVISLMVVDDDEDLLAAITDLVAGEPSINLVGTSTTIEGAVSMASRSRPDVALVDVRMPRGGGPALTRELRSLSPGTHVAAFSIWSDRALMLEMLRAGASAYIVKGVSVDEITDTIRRTHLGQVSFSAEVASAVVDEIVVQLEREDRERDIRVRQVDRIVGVLKHDLLTSVFQPIVDMRDGRIVGVEALARFPVEPARTPDVWFKEAEAVGLRPELEIAALREALAGLPRLPEDAYLAVNLSPELVHSEEFQELMRRIDPHRIVLEIAESMPVENYAIFGDATSAMRARGIRLAIDDAGLGYSLHHILQLEPDVIKLDIALCRNIDGDTTRQALTRALASFADQIGAGLVAEGIERQEEADTLLDLGVVMGQGFHFYRPGALPIAEPGIDGTVLGARGGRHGV